MNEIKIKQSELQALLESDTTTPEELDKYFVTDFDDGPQRRGQITSIVCEHGRAHPHLRISDRRFGVGAELVIEAPARHLLAKRIEFGIGLRLLQLREHRL